MFAKASILWNPLIYALRSKAMKKALAETYPFLRWIGPKAFRKQKLELRRNQTTHTVLKSNALNGSDVVVHSSGDNHVTSTSL